MNRYLAVAAILLSVSPMVSAANYKGRNIDGRSLECTAWNDLEKTTWKVQAVFDDLSVSLTLPDGSIGSVNLLNAEIDDASSIAAMYLYHHKAVHWELDCSASLD